MKQDEHLPKKKKAASRPSPDYSYTQNRELSWLAFDTRVLEEAEDRQVPLYERLKFTAIFSSNLDEFFMIRVGSLTDLSLMPGKYLDNKTSWTPAQQLDRIFDAVLPLYQRRDSAFAAIEEALQDFGYQRLTRKMLQGSDRKFLEQYFKTSILPVLSPQIIDPHHPFPHLVNGALYIILLLKGAEKTTLGILPIPACLPPYLCLPEDSRKFLLMEQILLDYSGQVFDGFTIQQKAVIRVTRNADISPDDEHWDLKADCRERMIRTLKKRAKLAPVRLEYSGKLKKGLLDTLCSHLLLSGKQVFSSQAPLQFSYIWDIAGLFQRQQELFYRPFLPRDPLSSSGESVVQLLKKGDLLLHHPYDSLSPFLQLIREAARDPETISIKITIYRVDKHSRLMRYLCEAAENGKEVTVLVELKARFDEQNNLEWAERLTEAGCTVLYGRENLKVHAKICLITQVSAGRVLYLTQIGTGNYHEKTASQYTDFSLMTSHPEIGADAAAFFKDMALSLDSSHYRHFLVAPSGFKPALLHRIREQAKRARQGIPSQILIKCNSLADREIIDALQEASAAGVPVQLLIRGICCMVPGIAGKTENIQVSSVVGRFLEHSRVYVFGPAEDCQLYISSADLMARNTKKRVEIACPVLDPILKAKIRSCFTTLFRDNQKRRELGSDCQYHLVSLSPFASNPPLDAQAYFLSEEN